MQHTDTTMHRCEQQHEDTIDLIMKVDPTWCKRLTMMAYLSFVRNERRKGVLFARYKDGTEALDDKASKLMYVMDRGEVMRLQNMLVGVDNLLEVFDLYDEDMQVLILVLVGRESFMWCETYTMEETHMWSPHVDCMKD